MPERITQPKDLPENWRRDLNPNFEAGINDDLIGPHPAKTSLTAYDVKPAHRRLRNLPDEELRKIPILPEGSRLEQGATYIDLREPEPREFTATGGMAAGPGNWYVPKTEVGYVLWNRLIGVQDLARLDESGRA